MKRAHSTGKLTAERRKQQDACFQENHKYDYVIIGAGVSALTVGALLTNAGFRVCILEAHDLAGGYAHTFAMNDFHFCAQVHYIWGCAPGQRIFEFLKYINLEKEVTFQSYDPDGYDHVSLPDGKIVRIPYGFDRLSANINKTFPGQERQLAQFISVVEKIYQEIGQIPHNTSWWKYLLKAPRYLTVIKYRNKTLQDLFDECSLSKEIQAILSATSGDFMAPPKELSLLAFVLLFSGYNEGAYYPTNHYKHFIESLTNFIVNHSGCHIYYETEVSQFSIEGEKVSSVQTSDGKSFKAKNFICNMDPQKASHLIGRNKFPASYLPALSYDYSPASFIVYLGIKDIDLNQCGFGNYNIWHLSNWDMNKCWQSLKNNCFDSPWLALSTPTLHTPAGGSSPCGTQILELTTFANYSWFKHLYDTDPKKYREEKRVVSEKLLDIVENRYIPNLRKHIALKVVGTPTTNEDFCFAPQGNSYGAHLSPGNMGLRRLKAQTPWGNFFWCNATSGYGGVYGAVYTGMQLYTDLTNDHFYRIDQAPSTLAGIAYARALSQNNQIGLSNE